MELTACPVRVFYTPEIRAWLDLFRQTHEVRADAAGVRWQRTSDIRRFEARTCQALDFIRRQWNSVIASETTRPTRGGARV
jgi:hypothetical protein